MLLSLHGIWLFSTGCQMLCVNKGRDTLTFGMVLSFFREDLLLLLRQLGQREAHLVQSRVKAVHTWALVFVTAHVFPGCSFLGFPAYISFLELPWQICTPWVVQNNREIIYLFTVWRPGVQNLGVRRVGCFWKALGEGVFLVHGACQQPLALQLCRSRRGLCLHMAFFPLCPCPSVSPPLLRRTPVVSD